MRPNYLLRELAPSIIFRLSGPFNKPGAGDIMKAMVLLAALSLGLASWMTAAEARGGGGHFYGGGHHTSSHGGFYAGGSGSSHRGGTYHGPYGGYGRHR
jgi:hypothetical protein